MADLIEQLERTRPGYAEEQKYHRLLIDAYEGTGGFAGSAVQPPAGFWGPASEAYTGIEGGWQSASITYLDRFPREDDRKFERRKQVAHYPNYIAPLTDLKTDFILRKEFMVSDRPEPLKVWRENVDGRGSTWDEILPDLAVQAATVGWLPVVVDMPPQPRDENGEPIALTRADAKELGIQPSIVALFPANLVDYQVDDQGAFEWAKIRTDHREQPDPFGDVLELTRYTIWYPNRFEQYEVTQSSNGHKLVVQLTPPGGSPHSFREVPIAILKNKKALNEPVRGLPMHGQETMEARRLFNAHSELDEHMRSAVFALLVLATKNSADVGAIITGSANGIPLDPESAQKHYYLSPEASVADAYEKRIETIIMEIYRQARVEFTRPTQSRAAVSGIARKFEFAQTDRALAAYAKQIARFEEHIDRLVGRGLGLSEDVLDKETITAPDSFDVEDLQSDLQLAIDAITQLQVGPTAERILRGRVIDQLLPNLTDADRSIIEAELEEQQKRLAEQERANVRIADALDAANPDNENPDDNQEEEQP